MPWLTFHFRRKCASQKIPQRHLLGLPGGLTLIHSLSHTPTHLCRQNTCNKSEYQTIFIVYSSKGQQIMYKSVQKHDISCGQCHFPKTSFHPFFAN